MLFQGHHRVRVRLPPTPGSDVLTRPRAFAFYKRKASPSRASDYVISANKARHLYSRVLSNLLNFQFEFRLSVSVDRQRTIWALTTLLHQLSVPKLRPTFVGIPSPTIGRYERRLQRWVRKSPRARVW